MSTMTRRAWAGLVATVVGVSAVTTVATSAWADHQFSDVPSGSFFHDEIAAIFDAGCASGFGDGTFRAGDPTTRGQFTFWLNNCGGRVAFGNDGPRALTSNTESSLAQAEMTAGALPTGGGFVVALASFDVQTPAGGAEECVDGCAIEFRLRRGAAIVETVSITVSEDEPSSGSAHTVFPVTGASDTTVSLAAAGNLGAETATAEGSVTLLYVPFAGDGTGGGQESG